jgi:hypothetical protein
MPDDAGVRQQAQDVRLPPGGKDRRIETGKGGTERLALAKDGDPGEAGLEPFQHQKLEEPPGVVFRDPPFVVVIADVKRVGPAP